MARDDDGGGRFKNVREAAQRGPLVRFGGVPRPEVVARLQAELGVEVVWPDADRCGPRPIERMRSGVANGSVSAVALLEAFMGHRHSKVVRQAARARGVPVA